jgi:SAM-dependent methyltransferase
MDEYATFHKKRYDSVLHAIDKYSEKLKRIGIIGYSPFDQSLREKYKNKIIINLVPPELASSAPEYISRDFIEVCGLEVPPSEFKNRNNNYDGVVFTEVLEHLFFRDDFIMQNLYSLVKPKGYMFFSVPNVAALGKLIMLFVGKNPYMSKINQIERVYGGHGHIREYSFSEAKKLCENAGFKIECIYGLNDYPTVFDKMARLMPKIYSETIMVIAKKPEFYRSNVSS